LPMKNAAQVELRSDDVLGPFLQLVGSEGEQRVWLDPATGQARRVEWTGGKTPARVTFDQTPPDAPPAGLTVATLDGKLEVVIRYREPRMNTGFDPSLLPVTVPERVNVRDFR
jgi:outer membrane lipoprotein-sorting protein